MSWMSQLLKTYEKNLSSKQSPEIQMTPVAHMNANAQIEVTLNEKGKFLRATAVDKADAVTLIPVTEASAGRSSGAASHALSDTLSYIAGDFSNYCEKKKEKKNAEEKFEMYISRLKSWNESEYTHPKIKAIYTYLEQKKLISDLISCGLVGLTEQNFFDSKKISGQPYEKAIVRFVVLDSSKSPDETWKDETLIKTYTDYYLAEQQGNRDICYLTGQESIISENHPKGIIAANYGAKLVSANDNQGYTFRGRFQNAEQSYALSYEASQKIHSALTWLARTQGAYVGTQDKRMFICWNPNGKKTPHIFNELGLVSDQEYGSIDSGKNYRKKLIKTFQGYKDQFDESDEIIILGLDAATTGRLSVTYYYELPASDFMERIMEWGETCRWFYLQFNEQKKPYYAIETPFFRRIVECAFGRELNKDIQVNDKLLKEQIQRLVKCMLEKQPVPFDLVQALTNRASTPLAYSNYNRERVLSTACAIISKYYYDRNYRGEEKGVYDDMKLDVKNSDRSYLFGRLLAVFEKAERSTYERDEKREPNAIRLQSAYVNHPMQTWKILEDLLKPYFQKLNPGSREFYKNLIGEILGMLQPEDEKILNQELKETYLLGYYLQRAELNKGKKEQEEM